jgi:hypothetical protein
LAKIRFHPNNKHKNKIQKLKDRLYVITKPENMAHLNFLQKRIRIAKEYYSHAEYFKDLGFLGLASKTFLKAVLFYPAIGAYYQPKNAGKLSLALPYRIIRPYIQMVYWGAKSMFRKEEDQKAL